MTSLRVRIANWLPLLYLQRWGALASMVVASALQATTAGAASPAHATTLFGEAADNYNERDYEGARAAYQAILDEGWVSASLLYNLGNATLRTGDAAQAVLQYRRAWMLAPRDPDISANLAFAAGRNQALLHTWPAWVRVFLLWPRAAWASLTAAAYWSLALLLILRLTGRLHPDRFARLAGPAAFLLACGLAGTGAWLKLQAQPEFVVLETGHEALYAPLDDAQPHFAVPRGSLVSIRDRSANWVRVAVGEKEGWLPASCGEEVASVPYL